MAGNILVYDTEIFENLLLVCLYDPGADEYRDFLYSGAGNDAGELRKCLESADALVSFNGLGFDNIILRHFFESGDVPSTKCLADAIIGRSAGRRPSRIGNGEEIDVCMILDRKASLKAFQARLQLERICEWEGDFAKPIPEAEIPALVDYCRSDCRSTWLLYREPSVQAKIAVKRALGGKYGIEFNNTESSMAEEILEKEIKAKLGLPGRCRLRSVRKARTGATGAELLSGKIAFCGEYLSSVLAQSKDFRFEYIERDGKSFLARKFAQGLEIPKPDGTKFGCNLGVGGMHSTGIHAAVIDPPDGKLVNYDVSSYYPSTIDLLGIAPAGIEDAFLGTYRPLIAERLRAKAAGEKTAANSLKIVLNAAFGRLKYSGSCLHDPASFLAVTLNCQFFYLMLIEQFLLAGVEILQVNTDGILVHPRSGQTESCEKIVAWWSSLTGYALDRDTLDGVLIRDSNNYAWAKGGRIVKEKGKGFRSGEKRLDVDCGFPLVSGLAVQEHFLRGADPAETVRAAIARREWRLFALWGSRKERGEADEGTPAQEGKRRVRRYVYTKSPVDKIQGVAGNAALLEDARRIDWESLDAEKYIAEARAVILACTEGQESAEAFRKGEARKAKPPKRSKGRKEACTPLFDGIEDEETGPGISAAQAPFGAIPEEIRRMGQWLLWRLEQAEGREKPAKVPYSVRGARASTTDPAHWSTFAECLAAWGRGGYNGLGFVFAGNGIVGIDLDGVVEGGEIRPDIREWVRRLGTYTETSQSGKGLHILARGTIPGGRHRAGCAEIYETGRYFAMTGNPADGSCPRIRECQEELDAFYEEFFGERQERKPEPGARAKESPQMADEEILRKARAARNNAKFAALYDAGDLSAYSGDDSAADFALCCLLGFYTQDPEQIDRLFRQSALFGKRGRAEKWDSRRKSETYGGLTIRNALEGIGETWQPGERPAQAIDRGAARPQIESIPAEQAPGEEDWEKASLDEYEARIRSIEPGTILMVSGATGAGKTFRGLRALSEREGPATVFSPTRYAAHRAISLWKGLAPHGDLGLALSGATGGEEEGGDEEEAEQIGGAAGMGRLVSTSFGYLGRKGHKGKIYALAGKLIEDRTILVDEPQKLWDAMHLFYKLAKRYWVKADCCEGIGTCLVHAKKGDCGSCFLGYSLKSPAGRGQQRKFYRDFQKGEQAMETQARRRDLGVLRWEDIDDMAGYSCLSGTSFYRRLPDLSGCEIPQDTAGSTEPEYLSHLLKTLRHPQLRRQHPATKTGDPCEAAHAHRIPQYPCEPGLMGIDFLPLLQLMEAESAVFTSATMPKGFASLVEDLAMAKGKSVQRICLAERPAKFRLALIKMTEPEDREGPKHALSLESQARILAGVDERRREAGAPVRSFAVTAKRSEALGLYALAQQAMPRHARMFDQGQFENESDIRAQEENTGDLLVTYGRSALGTGAGMADKQLLLLSAKQFLPMMAVMFRPGMTEEQARREIFLRAKDEIDQIIGRLFRTSLPLNPGEVVNDPRQIVAVIHGLPPELASYAPNQDALHEYREYTPEQHGFLPATGTGIASAMVEAVCACLAGQDPPDRRRQDLEKYLAKAGEEKSVRALSRAQREATRQSRAESREEKARAKIEQARRMLLEEGATEAAVEKKFHIERLNPESQDEFWKAVYSE